MDVTLTDERADLVALGIDVAVWLGELEDSSMVAPAPDPWPSGRLCEPALYSRARQPETPEDLHNHNCIVYCARGYDNLWRIQARNETTRIEVSGNLQSVSSAVLLASARSGLGLVVLQETMVREPISGGELVQVLGEYQVSSTDLDIGIYAVYPGRRRISPKARAFIDFLVTLFRT